MKASSFLTACLLVTALWGCSNTQENSLTDSQRLGIKSCSARGEAAGEISEFGMFVTNQNGSAVDGNGDNAHVYLEHGLWNVPHIAIKSGQTLQLFAYSPYMEGMTVTDIAVSLSSQTDYLYSKGQTVTYSSYTPDIELHHLLSKVTVQVNEERAENLSVSDYPESGSLNLFAGTLTKGNTLATVSGNGSGILLFPGATDVTVTITYRGKQYHYPLSVNLEPGKEYVYSLILQENNKLEVGNVSVIAWVSGGDYDGTIEPEIL